MKRTLIFIILTLMLTFLVISCKGTKKSQEKNSIRESKIENSSSLQDDSADKLKFMLTEDNTYEVSVGDATEIGNIIIPDSYNGKSVTAISGYGFYGCVKLTSITFPNSIKYIGEYAFYGCKNLSNIVVPKSIINIGNEAFCDCCEIAKINYLGTIEDWCNIDFVNSTSNPLRYAKELYINDILLTRARIIATTKIKDFVFYSYDKLTEVVIGSHITSIGSNAFYGCVALENATISDGVTEIDESAFAFCALKQITIPNSVVNLGDYAFSGCYKLTDIVMGKNVAQIGNYAFQGCRELQYITLGDYISSIGKGMFFNCEKLKRVTLSENVKNIESNVFYNCNNLASIRYLGTKTQWDSITKKTDWNYSIPSTCKVECKDKEFYI